MNKKGAIERYIEEVTKKLHTKEKSNIYTWYFV